MLLVGGFKHDFYFPFHKKRDVIVPIDFNSIIFQDGHIAPPSRLPWWLVVSNMAPCLKIGASSQWTAPNISKSLGNSTFPRLGWVPVDEGITTLDGMDGWVESSVVIYDTL